MRRVEGKVAIITGGAGGLGSAAARRLASEGATVLIADIAVDAAEKVANEIGGGASAVHLDAFDPASIKAMVDTAIERYGRLDILNNNVAHTGGTGADTTVLETSIETWDQSFAVNVRSYFIATKYALPHMLKNGSGSIVNIASIHGQVGDPNVVAHCASKFGLVGLTKASADALREHQVRVNAIAPGAIDANSLDRWGTGPDQKVTQADIASLIVYLSSDLSRSVTGSVIEMYGSTHSVIKI